MTDRDEQVFTKQILDEIPRKTGVYIFQGPPKVSGEPSILYVGKAKNLNARVRQYFSEVDTRPFVAFIRKKVESVRTIVVSSDQDALLLENELIKKFRPSYNIMLKDDKRYLSLRLDMEHEWPKIDVVRKIKRDGAVYLGPFSSASRLRMTLDFMQKMFPLRTCSDHKLYNRSRPCIEYEIKRCVAPCVNLVSKPSYTQLVQRAVMFLKGQNEELLSELKGEMERAASGDDFERAAELRDKIEAIRTTTTDTQKIVSNQQFQQGLDLDAVGMEVSETEAVFVVVFIRSGVVFDQRTFIVKRGEFDPTSLMFEFLNRYYTQDVYLPHEVLVPFELEGLEVEANVKMIVPRAAEKRQFLDLAMQNAKIQLEGRVLKSQRLEKTLTGLQRILGTSKFPRTMDCIDISHHQGAETVASVVRFRDGSPEKDFYRRLKLSVDQVNDFDSMREVVSRRYHSQTDLPDLLVIDGGPGQLSSAVEVLRQQGWLEGLDIVSLAKAREGLGIDPLNPQNRERIFRPDQKNPILLKKDSAEELLLRFLRDEAHRFAITYHRLRKNKSMSVSALDDVPGMTERSKTKLLRRFGSVEGILEAEDIDLLKEVSEKLVISLRLTLNRASGE